MIFGCWYTSDYAHHVPLLRNSVCERGFDLHRIELKPKEQYPWEHITRAKAGMAVRIMERNRGKTVVLVDVDAEVVGTREDVLRMADIPGDVGFHVRSLPRQQSRHRPTRQLPRSGTMVLRPTSGTARLLDVWREMLEDLPPYEPDETALMPAICKSCVTLTYLPEGAAWLYGDSGQPIILHHGAGKRTPRWRRWIGGQMPWRKIWGK